MKDIWFGFWSGFDRIFKNPSEIHRVLAIGLLSVSISHALYMYNLIENYLWVTSSYVSLWLGVAMGVFLVCWSFRSNEMSIDLFNRFIIVSGLFGLFHRMIFYSIELGDPYFVTMSIICFIVFGVWAVTGKNYAEIKTDYLRPGLKIISRMFFRHEKKDNIHVMPDSKFSNHG